MVEFGAWVLVVPPRSIKDGEDPATDPAAREPQRLVEPIVVRASDGARLAGRWFPAPGPAATGRTVLLLHGFAEDSSALGGTAGGACLHRHGWNVAALDSRGYGQSEGPYASFGGREAGDVRVWLDALAEHVARIDPAVPFRPALWGRSMGAAIALRAAAQTIGSSALVLESPLVDLDAIDGRLAAEDVGSPSRSSWPGSSPAVPASWRACRSTGLDPSTRPQRSHARP